MTSSMSLFRPCSRSTFLFRTANVALKSPARPSFRAFTSSPFRFSESSAPVVLPKLKEDLKTALRAKDKPRLNTLRALLAEITNASKTAKPVDTDAALYGLLNKSISQCLSAIQEFDKAKRQDLVQKEEEQVLIMQEYLEAIPTVSEQDLKSAVKAVVEKAKAGGKNVASGMITGLTMSSETVRGKPVDMTVLKRIIDEEIGGN